MIRSRENHLIEKCKLINNIFDIFVEEEETEATSNSKINESFGYTIEFSNDYQNTLYKCSQCSYETDRYSQIESHINIHKPNQNVYKCFKCGVLENTISGIKKHFATHYSFPLETYQKLTNCDISNVVPNNNNNKYNYETIQNVEDGWEFYKCNFCNYESLVEDYIKIHCSECNKYTVESGPDFSQQIPKKSDKKSVLYIEDSDDDWMIIEEVHENTQNNILRISEENNNLLTKVLTEIDGDQSTSVNLQLINDCDILSANNKDILNKDENATKKLLGSKANESNPCNHTDSCCYVKKKKKFDCKICSFKTKSKKKWKKHDLKHFKIFRCKDCNFLTTKLTEIMKHKELHKI